MSDDFEKVVKDLVRRLSPHKKNITIPPENLKKLKEVVRNGVLQSSRAFMLQAASHPVQSTSSNDSGSNNAFVGSTLDDDDSRMSGCDSSEDSQSLSQYSNDEDSRSFSGGRRIAKSSSSASLNQQNSKGQKQNNRIRRLQELRTQRRKLNETEEVHEFECGEGDLVEVFTVWYAAQLDLATGETTTLRVFHLLINSLRNFFTNITWQGSVNKLLLKFLQDNVLLTSKELNHVYDVEREAMQGEREASRRRLETQLQVLLEMYAISIGDEADEKNVDDVVKKLILFAAIDLADTKTFLEESMADSFAHLLPREVVAVFDELCIAVPADLEEHDPATGLPVADDYLYPRFVKNSSETQRMMENMVEESAPMESTNGANGGGGKENGRRRDGEKTSSSSQRNTLLAAAALTAPDPSTSRRRSTDQSSISRQIKAIPDTPEEKLRAKHETMDDDDGVPEIVKQTPMGKVRPQKKGASRRLSELVKISEERSRPSRAAAIASEKASRAIIAATVAPASNRQLLLALNTPSPRPIRSARSNLIDRFCSEAGPSPLAASNGSTDSSSGSSVPEKRKASIRSAPRELASTPPERKRSRLSAPTQPSPQQSDLGTGIVGFGIDQLNRYKQRMSEISRTKESELQPDNPWRLRTSLYEEQPEEGKKTEDKDVQKNRQGRVIRASTTVHLAHVLLNVHNPAPLDAFKAYKMGAGAPVKLHRLVRIAKKKERKKLNKLRNRVRFNHAPSPSVSQKSDSVDHALPPVPTRPSSYMRGDSDSPAGQRRSQRQRIDLSIGEEGFDRHELERALRASLDEEKVREKDEEKSPKKTTAAAKKVEKKPAAAPAKAAPAPAKTAPKKAEKEKAAVAAPPKKSPATKRKQQPESDSEGDDEPEEKQPAKKVPKKEAKKPATAKPVPAAKAPAKSDSKKEKVKEVKEKESKEVKEKENKDKDVKETVSKTEKKPAKQQPAKSAKSAAKPKPKVLPKVSPKKETKAPPTKATPISSPRESELGKRVAHTQASNFITLLACATKVLGGDNKTTDYIL